DHPVPQWLKLLPPSGIGQMAQFAPCSRFGRRALPDRSPTVKVSIGAPVAAFKRLRREQRGTVDDMARVVAVPIVVGEASFGLHPAVERGAGIGREDVKGGGFDALLDGPAHSAIKDA